MTGNRISDKLKASVAYAKNLFTTGAITETSRKVEIEICRNLSRETSSQVVVEFGMGHGNITKEILSNLSEDSKLYAFEVNKEFCDYVQDNITDQRLVIVNDGAQNLYKHVKEPINHVISSIPLTLFPKELTMDILSTAYKALVNNGYYSQILYSKVHVNKFKEVFDELKITRNFNFPMEYIHHNRKIIME